MLKLPGLYQIFSALLFLFFIPPGFSQPVHFTTTKFTPADGLPDTYILSIFQDSRGFLWIGTSNGISRFDGKHFKNYNLSNNLPSLFATLTFEDKEGRLWASTRRGIAVLRGDQFYSYPLSDSVTLKYSYSIIDVKNLGVLAPTSNGIYRFEKDRWQKFNLYPGLEDHGCSLAEAGDGLYISYGDHLVKRNKDGNTELLGKRNGNQGPFYRGLDVFSDTVHVSTEEGFFQYFNGQKIPLFENPLRGKLIQTFLKDSRGRYWVSTLEDGVMISEPDNTKEFAWRLPVTQNFLSKIFEDRSGNIWLAGIDGLLLVHEQGFEKFRNKYIDEVQNILDMPQTNEILVHSRPFGLLTFRDHDFRPSPISLPNLPEYDKTQDIIDYYCRDDKSRVWMSTRFQKLFCLENGNMKDYTYLVGHPLTILAPDYNLFRKRLSIASDTFMIGDEHSLRPFFASNTGKPILNAVMNKSFSNGMQIVSTQFDGIMLLDLADNVTSIHTQLGSKKYMYGLVFLEEPGGKFWIYNNGEGLSRFHWNKNNLPEKDLEITTANGLPNNLVKSICLDKYNGVWVSTIAGIVLVKPDSTGNNQHAVYNLSSILNIDMDRLANAKLLTAQDGSVWLSKYSEIFHFAPGRLKFPETSARVCIENIQVLSATGKLFDWPTLEQYWLSPVSAVLSHRENNIRINYTGITFQNYEGLQYSYRLEGLDTNWSQPSANTSITYAKLSPGSYTFQVRVKNTDGRWSDPANFSFSIRTPFWLTWWFRLGIVLVFSALLILIFRLRLKQIQKKVLLESQIRELEMNALRAQMNPHFIYNALNSIQSLILNDRSREAGGYISKFAKLLRQVLENADKNLVSLDKELYSLQLYTDLEKLRLSIDIEFLQEIDQNIDTANIMVPPLILQPFVENALWHGLSRKQGLKKIILRVDEDNDWVICTITDNGIGREKARENYSSFPEGNLSKATSITRKRLIEFNKTGDPEPITILDLQEDGQPAGTKVIIRIKK